MTQPNRPQLKLEGNISENFKNFELRFSDYCLQADYRDLTKDPNTAAQRGAHYKKPLLELAALRSALPDEALQVVRYTIEPQITADDTETMDLDDQTKRTLHWFLRQLPNGRYISILENTTIAT